VVAAAVVAAAVVAAAVAAAAVVAEPWQSNRTRPCRRRDKRTISRTQPSRGVRRIDSPVWNFEPRWSPFGLGSAGASLSQRNCRWCERCRGGCSFPETVKIDHFRNRPLRRQQRTHHGDAGLTNLCLVGKGVGKRGDPGYIDRRFNRLLNGLAECASARGLIRVARRIWTMRVSASRGLLFTQCGQ